MMPRWWPARAVGLLALLIGIAEMADGLSHASRLTVLLRAEAVVGVASALGGWGLLFRLPWSRRLVLGAAPVQTALAVWNAFAGRTIVEVRVPVAVVMVLLQIAVITALRHPFLPTRLRPPTR
jgi:hypothetical protein